MSRTLPARRVLPLLACTLAGVILSACGSSSQAPSQQATAAPTEAVSTEVLDQNLPVDAMPEVPDGKDGFVDCPYLDSTWVADTNGQRMTGHGIDTRFDTPACVFWSYPNDPQATVIVRHMHSTDEAIAVVDWAAPINTTEPAEEPEGWSGGRIGNENGAIYAVQKGPVAVVVFSNQQQSLKAELIAKEVITNLGL